MAGGLKYALFHIVDGVVDHTGIKDLDLRLDVALLEGVAKLLQEGGRIHKHGTVLPVQGTGVVGGEFGQQLLEGIDSLFVAKVHRAGAGDIDAHVAVLVGPDAVHRLLVEGKVGGGGAVGVADVDMDDGGAGLPAVVRLLGDLLRGVGHGGVHILGGPGTAQGGGDDSLLTQVRHSRAPFKMTEGEWWEKRHLCTEQSACQFQRRL